MGAGFRGDRIAGANSFPEGSRKRTHFRTPLDIRRLRSAMDALRGRQCNCRPNIRLPSPFGRGAGAALQIHNRYLVTETEEGVTIIDQHALHERILYEQLRQRVAAGAIETQSLLVPEPVDLSPAETSARWSIATCWPSWA